MRRPFAISDIFTWRTFSQLILLLGVIIMILPFLYMLGTSFKTSVRSD